MANKPGYKILIVEDDPGVSVFLKTTVGASGYDVIKTKTGSDALHIIASQCPDCILLDLGLPDMDGSSIIQCVRSWSKMPIIVVSARTTEEDIASALDAGVDDYIKKPFGSIELLARIRAALRHTRTSSDNDEIGLTGSYHVGELEIDYNKLRVLVSGRDVQLTPIEYRIVAFLGRHAGRVITYKTLLRELWGPSAGMDNKILRVHMASVRRKIEPDPNDPIYIITEVGVGYRMAETDDSDISE